jgi:DNA-binding NarL/FixJ family response regulator
VDSRRSAPSRLKPSVLVLDAALLDGDVLLLLPLIRRKSPGTRVLLLTDHAPEARTLDTLSLGAWGYLEKTAVRAYLPRAVRVVAAGQAWVPRKMVARIMDHLARLTVESTSERPSRVIHRGDAQRATERLRPLPRARRPGRGAHPSSPSVWTRPVASRPRPARS